MYASLVSVCLLVGWFVFVLFLLFVFVVLTSSQMTA